MRSCYKVKSVCIRRPCSCWHGLCYQMQWAGTFRSWLSKQQWWWHWCTWRRSWHVWHTLLQLQRGRTYVTQLSYWGITASVGRQSHRGAGWSSLTQRCSGHRCNECRAHQPEIAFAVCISEAEQISRLVVENCLLFMLYVLLTLCIPFQVSQASLL